MSDLGTPIQPKTDGTISRYEGLLEKAKKLRQATFNTFIERGEAHLGGSFSMIEMLITLYEKILKEEVMFLHRLLMVPSSPSAGEPL